MLAGGPGESALTSFVQILATPGMEGFWAERDVVLVEQRLIRLGARVVGERGQVGGRRRRSGHPLQLGEAGGRIAGREGQHAARHLACS